MLKVVSSVSTFAVAVALAFTVSAGAQTAKKISSNVRETEFAVRPVSADKHTLWRPAPRPTHASASKFRSAITSTRRAASPATGIMRAPAASFPDLLGSVTYSADNAMTMGLYAIGPDASLTKEIGGVEAAYGGVLHNGVYYYIDGFSIFGMNIFTVYGIDIASGERLFSYSGDDSNVYLDMTSDPVSGNIYALGIDDSGTTIQLMKVSITESNIANTVVADMPGNWISLACDGEGQLYAISQTVEDGAITGSDLYKVDKLTGALTHVGETGQNPYYSTSATIDPKSGRMFWTVCPYTDEGYLCEVNTATGEATILGEFAGDEQVQGLCVRLPLAEPDAPASATDLSANFVDGSLSGTVEFTAPATTFDGTPAEGNVSYEVAIEGMVVHNATTTYGASVSVPVALAKSGEYNFSVVMSNVAGKSPVASTSAYVGMGVPKAPVVTLTYSEGNMQLSWEPVAATVNGVGHIDPAAVTYTVTSFPADEVVYEGNATSYSEAVEDPGSLTQFYYSVVAHNGDVSSEAATSNAIALGSIVPPYSNTFDNSISLEGYTIIDGNDDGNQWTVYDGKVRMRYNEYQAMDDWLITPPLKLEAGKSYMVTFDASTNLYDERVEAKWGMQPTVEGMTENLVAPTDLDGNIYTTSNPLELGDYITPAVSGTYYIGIHGISDADCYYLYIDNLKISAPVSGKAPGVVTDLKALTDPDGAFKTTVSFVAPAETHDGSALAAITHIDVVRGNETVHTFENVAPGQACSFVDEVGVEGTVTYTVVAYNEDGAGSPVEVSTFVGIDVPAAPENVRITDSATDPGMITVSWDAVATDRNGQPINPSFVTYTVAEYEDGYGWVDMESGLTETSYTFRAVAPGEQTFVQYAVFAETATGYNGAASELEPVGTPYDGLDETFPDGHMTYDWAVGYSAANGKWYIYSDNSMNGMSSFDNDNGYAGMQGYSQGAYSSLISGKISLDGSVNPGIALYAYSNGADDNNSIEVFVREAGADEWTSAGTFVTHEVAAPDSWGLIAIPLADYAGKVVQVRIQAMTQTYSYTFVDALHVGALLDYDIAVKSITAPESVKPGSDYMVSVKVSNMGVKTVDAYAIELYEDGEKIATKEQAAIAAGVSVEVAFGFTMSPVATEPIEYKAVVSFAGDEKTENNESAAIEVAPILSTLPRVTDLSGEYEDGIAVLTWTAPDVASAVVPGTTDFEDADSWEHEYDGWTFADLDGSPVGGFSSADIPGIVPDATTASFFVFDSSDGYNETFVAHSGHKYLAALYRWDGGQTDDWAISPELSGNAQTISFWARSYSSSYPEKMEMYYSKGGGNIEDFVKVGETVEAVPNSWTEYSFDVPEGAVFFAIRSCATDSFVLMLDDFTFISSEIANISINGYEVYRDGVKVNSTLVKECTYTDTQAPAGTHTYVVVTEYTLGNSAPSNAVVLSPTTGIDAAAAQNIVIAGGKGIITVAGAEGKLVTIAAADGKVIFSGEAAARETVAVSAGIYVVRAGNTAAKVAVK